MSDTYMGVDYETEVTMTVVEKSAKLWNIDIPDDDDDDDGGGLLPSTKEELRPLMYQLRFCTSEEDMEMKLTKLIYAYRNNVKMEGRTAGHSTPLTENRVSQRKKPTLPPEELRARIKQSTHSLYKRMFYRKKILRDGLEDLIPDTLAGSNWSGCCDPKTDYMSEWRLKLDSESNEDENLANPNGELKDEMLNKLDEGRAVIGREIGIGNPKPSFRPDCKNNCDGSGPYFTTPGSNNSFT
jgi:hypothetical protein